MNPLKELGEFGQSVWLDFIQRKLLTGGELKRMVEEDGLKGVTSNPAIFEKAIADSDDYDDVIAELGGDGSADPKAVYEAIATRDIQDAADVLRPVYDETERRDGYVSLEVSPYLAHDTEATVAEARRLWNTVSRDNLLIKVPGTPEGVPAIEQLIGEGISVNVTLLFAREAYEQVAQAYLRGLARAAADGLDVGRIASVASFFISRIDSLVDDTIQKRIEAADGTQKERLQACWARSPSPTPSSPTSDTRKSCRARGGRPWPPGEPGRSGSCGPAPAPRTRTTPTSCMSTNSSARTR